MVSGGAWGSGQTSGGGCNVRDCLAGGKKTYLGIWVQLGFGLEVKRVPGSYFVSGFGDLGP